MYINRELYVQSHSLISSSRIIGIELVNPRSGWLSLAAVTDHGYSSLIAITVAR